MSVPSNALQDWRKFALAGYAVIFLTFGIAGGWAAIAKIDRAVVAPGFVSVETNHKTVQHFEGGIIREILVKEGDSVKEGQVLIRMEKVQAQANSDLLNNQLYSYLALEARLLAERDEREAIAWPPEFGSRENDPQIAKLMSDEVGQFNERRSSLNGQIKIIESKAGQLKTEIGGIGIEKDSEEKQVKYINEELVSLRKLLAKQLVPTQRVFAMERERTRLEGAIGKAISDAAKAQGAIAEMGIQVSQLQQKFKEDVATALLDVRQKIGDYRQRSIVAQDVLRRIEVTSPRSGTVQNLKASTLGQVVRAGEALLDIVPLDERLIVQAQFSPGDIDIVHQGQSAEIRFPAFHSRTLPLMMGHLESVSRDRLMDEATKQPYYLGIVSINKADIPDDYRARLRSGMPAEIIVASGERTVLTYLVSPLSSSIRKTFIEQ
jgi:HlyD family secretion protein